MYESRRSVSYSHAERRIASPNQTGTCLFSFLSHIAESACVCVLVFARVRLLVSFVLHSSSPSYTQCRPPYLSSSLFFFSSHLPFHTFFFSSFFFFCVFLFSPIARVNLFATGSIARFLRLWTSCDQNFAFLSVRDVGIVLEK